MRKCWLSHDWVEVGDKVASNWDFVYDRACLRCEKVDLIATRQFIINNETRQKEIERYQKACELITAGTPPPKP